MRTSIKDELRDYIVESIKDRGNEFEGLEMPEIHHKLFNESYYIVYYSEAEKWLSKHGLSAFEAINIVQEYEKENFGETTTENNSEAIVNMLAYIYGQELLHSEFEELENLDEEELNEWIEENA